MKEKSKTVLGIFAVFMCIMLITEPTVSTNAAKTAAERCLGVIIPSLFAFMAYANLFIASGVYRIISKPLDPIAKYIFRMPGELFSVMLISNIAGFPVGASMLSQLADEGRISRKCAALMQCYCYGGGPSFSIGVIGMYLYGSRNVGLVIWLSGVISNAIMAMIINRTVKTEYQRNADKTTGSDILISSAQKAGSTILMICGLIIIFAVTMADIGQLISRTGIRLDNDKAALIKSVFEISSISGLDTKKISYIPLIAALFGFGGVCVLLQVVFSCKGSFSLVPFFVSRIPSFMLSMFICRLLINRFVDESKECFLSNDNIAVNFNNFIPSICLLLMIFLLLFRKRVAFSKDI